MNNSKLIRTLRILDAKELKRLLQFLKSPFYNSNPNIVKLYMLLRSHHPDFSSLKLTREKVFKKVFPDWKYEHQKMLNLMSDFTALLEKYMVVLQLEKEELEQKKLLVRSYSERPNCYDVFVKKNKEVEKYLDDLPYRDEIYFREKQELNLRYFGHPGTDMHTDGKEALRSAAEYSKAHQILSNVKIESALNAWKNTVGGRKNIGKIDEFLAVNTAAFSIYKKLNHLQIAGVDEEGVVDIASGFKAKINVFRIDDKVNILKILLNYSNRFVNQGKLKFITLSFELYKTGLDYNCLMVQGKLKETTYHNIVTFGTLNNEFNWTKEFIENYLESLDAKVRNDAYALAMGQWFFAKEEYGKVVEVLQHSFNETLDVLKSKTLIVRSWYELFRRDTKYFELLIAQLEAFEKYTRRNKTVSPRIVEGLLKFIGFTKKLTLIHLSNEDVGSIKSEIVKEKNVALKSWLLKKVVK